VKRCRLCGREFPDSYTYCDQDASTLPTVRRSWLPAALVAGGLAIALTAAAAIAGPPAAQRYIGSHISAEITGVSAGSGALSWPIGNVELNLRVHNSAPLSPSLRSLRFECALSSNSSSSKTVALEWALGPAQELSIAANRDTNLTVKASPRHIDPESILTGLQGNGDVVCKGPAVFSLWGIELSRDLEFEKRLL
jgi:hypothetical protein